MDTVTFGVGDRVTIAADHPPILAGAPVVWTITAIDVWPGTDMRYAVLKPSDRSEYPQRTANLSLLRTTEAAA